MKINFTIIKILVLSTFIIIIAGSCGTNLDPSPTKQINYTGEQLFRGLFFLQGEVPEKIESYKPSLDEYSTMKLKSGKLWNKYELFTNEIVNEINKIDPNYFSFFESSIKSHNTYEIEKALHGGALMIQKAGTNSAKYGKIFRSINAMEDDIRNKKLSIENINTDTEEGKQQLKKIIYQKYYSNEKVSTQSITDSGSETNSDSESDSGGEPDADFDTQVGIAVFVVVAIALAVWHAAGIYTVVTIALYHNTAVAHFINWTKTKSIESVGDGQTSQEQMIADIATSL